MPKTSPVRSTASTKYRLVTDIDTDRHRLRAIASTHTSTALHCDSINSPKQCSMSRMLKFESGSLNNKHSQCITITVISIFSITANGNTISFCLTNQDFCELLQVGIVYPKMDICGTMFLFITQWINSIKAPSNYSEVQTVYYKGDTAQSYINGNCNRR